MNPLYIYYREKRKLEEKKKTDPSQTFDSKEELYLVKSIAFATDPP